MIKKRQYWLKKKAVSTQTAELPNHPSCWLFLSPEKQEKKIDLFCFLKCFQSFVPCWEREEEGVRYQDALDGEILQPTIARRVEDDREGLVGGLHVAEFNLVLEKGWRR